MHGVSCPALPSNSAASGESPDDDWNGLWGWSRRDRMAWLHNRKRKNRRTGRMETYWSLCWRAEGRTHTRAIGFLSKADAERALKVFEGKVAEGDTAVLRISGLSSSGPKRRAPTLRDYLDDIYLPVVERDKAPKTVETERNAAKALKGEMGNLRLDEINFAVVDAYLSVRKQAGRKSRTLILEVRTLSKALRHAHACDVLAAVPELPRIKDRDRQPHRFLTAEESVALLDAIRPLEEQPHDVTRGKPPVRRDRLSYLAVLMALNTGARRNEILTRTWEDIHWDQGPHGTLIICRRLEDGFRVKKDRERAVPLTPELRAELEALHREVGKPKRGWLFPSPTDPRKRRKSFRTALVAACRRAGLPPIHPHGLRHTWASRLAMAGVDRRTLMELGGWKDGRMLDEVYAHATDAHKTDVMARMGITATSGAGPVESPPGAEDRADLQDRNARQLRVINGRKGQ